MKAALSILAPKESGFKGPTRKANPEYHEPIVQDAGAHALQGGNKLGAKTVHATLDAADPLGLIDIKPPECFGRRGEGTGGRQERIVLIWSWSF
jgi:hypothetical protein